MTNDTSTAADLRLRGSTGVVGARLHWPVPGPACPRLLVLFPAVSTGDALSDELCRARLMVLVAPNRNLLDAIATVEWAADHVDDLGAAGSSIALVGHGRGAALAAAVTWHAAAHGWPPVDPLVLIDPLDAPDAIHAHLLDSHGDGDVVSDLLTLLEGTNP